jgi:MFS family permease
MSSPYASFQYPDFKNFIFARFCVTLAIQVQATVVGWQLYEITKDPLSLGLIGLAEAAPSIAVSLYAGHVADVVNRKRIVMVTVAVLLLCSIALLALASHAALLHTRFGAGPIYATIFVSGIARGFLAPANFSLLPQLVPRALFANAVSLNSSFWQAAAIGGPMLAGMVYAGLGIQAAYLFDVALVLAALVLYTRVTNPPLPPPTGELGVRRKIKAGLKFVFNNQIILSAITLDLFAVLFGGAVALLPVFASDILFVGKFEFGVLRAAPGIGALLTAIYITHHPVRRRVGQVLLWAVAGFGLTMIGFGLSKLYWLSVLLLLLSGMFDSVSVIIRSTLIQTLTPENMKGRVAAVNNIFIGSSNELGALESGVAAKLLGVVPAVVAGGHVTLLVVGITAWKADKLRRLNSVEEAVV